MKRDEKESQARKLSVYLGKLYNYVRGPGIIPRCQVDEVKLMEDVMECIRGHQKHPPEFLRKIREILKDVNYRAVSKRSRRQNQPRQHRDVLHEILTCVAHHWGVAQRRSRVA